MQTKAVELNEKLIKFFSKEGEVWKIKIFGKLAENCSDNFSDVDIRIISKDPLITQQNAHRLIETNISPIISTFTLASNRDCFAEMIMLKDYPPYQKVDISIERDGAGIPFEPMATLYENSKAVGSNQDCQIYACKKTVDYNLLNVLFGIPRITKCFFRQDFDMYRRWKDQTNALLVLLNEKYSDWQEINEKKELSAHEAKLLFQNLTPSDKKRLNEVFPLTGDLKIPASFLNSLKFYVDLSFLKANKQRVTINKGFVNYIMKFAKEETSKL
jgi:hypothetical protein